MRCPHCHKEGRSKVLESRVWDGKNWRRRTCALCLKNFVSMELAEVTTRMPNETQSKFRAKNPTPKPEERNITSTAAHLQGIWREPRRIDAALRTLEPAADPKQPRARWR